MSDTDEQLAQGLDETEDQPTTGKGLRAQLEAALKAKNDLEAKYADVAGKARRAEIETVLVTRGANPRIAQFVPADIEGDAIAKWLDDNADLFAPKGSTPEVPSRPDPDPSVVDTARRVQGLGQTPQPGLMDDVVSRIGNAGSTEEVQQLWREAQRSLL
ncbi:MAG TPA: hypothetical protein VF104_00645 [Burkholderiales bacterium]